MFNKLRLKLTLINVTIIMALFAILITGTFLLMNYSVMQGSYYMLNQLSDAIVSGEVTDLVPFDSDDSSNPPPPPPLILGMIQPPEPDLFFVKTKDSVIAECSSGVTLNGATLQKVVHKIKRLPQTQGKLSLESTELIYQKTMLNDTDMLIVFNDLAKQNSLLKSQLSIFWGVGLFCALLSFIASFLLANSAIKPIRLALENQKSFVSDASHELRTPLTIIQTNLDIVKGAGSMETVAENMRWLDNIQGETTRMAELINSLLFLARADAKQQLLNMSEFKLDELIAETLTSLNIQLKKKQSSCLIHLPLQSVFSQMPPKSSKSSQFYWTMPFAIRIAGERLQLRCFAHMTIASSRSWIPGKELPHIIYRNYSIGSIKSMNPDTRAAAVLDCHWQNGSSNIIAAVSPLTVNSLSERP